MRNRLNGISLWRFLRVCFMLSVVVLLSCSKEDDITVVQPQRKWVTKTVVAVAPLSGDATVKTRLERTANWFLENFHEAQLNDTLAIDLKIEWHDEDKEDLSALSREVSGREDIIGVIGPFSNEHLEQFAPSCQSTQTPLIAPTATSEDIIRRYAVASAGSNVNQKPFLWSLTESDVTFTETLLGGYSDIFKYDNPLLVCKAVLFSPDNTYGNTFHDWAPFFAEEDKVELVSNLQYRGNSELQDKMNDYMDMAINVDENTTIASFCVVEDMSQMYDVARIRRKSIITESAFSFLFDTDNPDDPSLDSSWQLFSSIYNNYFALNDLSEEKLEKLGERGGAMLQGYVGFSPYADPTTGFELSYEKKFSVKPSFAESKFYDALMLMGFAACYEAHHIKTPDNATLSARNAAFNKAIVTITTPNENQFDVAAWNVTPMNLYLKEMEDGHILPFRGASGDIGFDEETYTASTHTTYVQWQILNGKFVFLNYYGGGSSGRLNDAHAAWKYLYDNTLIDESFKKQASDGVTITYPELEEQYAVLVQGSNGMTNYRHQSGVLLMYQLLKRGGFDDDHIILVMDAALASSSENNDKGAIRASKDGENLLEGVVVDYDNATLNPKDISDILQGKSSERLPVVVPGNNHTNVLLYWCGHGRSVSHGGSDEFVWRENPAGKGFTTDLMKQTIEGMSAEPSFRKCQIIAEACYAENVLKPIEGKTGVLALCGASGDEQSWAENWNPDLGKYGTWMSDRFTLNVVNFLSANPNANYRDLFVYCSQHTIGSHVRILNSEYFDNLYVTGPKEFIVTTN